WTVAGSARLACTCAINCAACPSETPAGRLNDTVADGSPSEWLTEALVDPVDQRAIADRGVIVRAVVLTALPAATADPPAPVPPVLAVGAAAVGVADALGVGVGLLLALLAGGLSGR